MHNRTLGTRFEQRFCEKMFNVGFWVKNMAQDNAGQPADVIAVKGGKAYLIDCKVMSGKTFPLSRVESNQHMAMQLWQSSGNGAGWLAIETNDGMVYMVSYYNVRETLKKSWNIENIRALGFEFSEWLELYDVAWAKK